MAYYLNWVEPRIFQIGDDTPRPKMPEEAGDHAFKY
jgi:hypothetical protein